MTQRATWKAFEKAIARVLHLVRISNLKFGLACEDVRGELTFHGTHTIVGECKIRDKFPSIITDMIAQARRNVVADDEIPVAFLKKKGAHIDNTVVALQLKDFLKIVKLEGESQ